MNQVFFQILNQLTTIATHKKLEILGKYILYKVITVMTNELLCTIQNSCTIIVRQSVWSGFEERRFGAIIGLTYHICRCFPGRFIYSMT